MPLGDKIDNEYSALNQRFTGTAVKVAIGTSAAASSALSVGRYRITANADCWILQGASTIASSLNMTSGGTGHYLASGAIDYLTVTVAATDGYVAVISSTAGGYFELMPQ